LIPAEVGDGCCGLQVANLWEQVGSMPTSCKLAGAGGGRAHKLQTCGSGGKLAGAGDVWDFFNKCVSPTGYCFFGYWLLVGKALAIGVGVGWVIVSYGVFVVSSAGVGMKGKEE